VFIRISSGRDFYKTARPVADFIKTMKYYAMLVFGDKDADDLYPFVRLVHCFECFVLGNYTPPINFQTCYQLTEVNGF
jgi:hypothetical protein